MASRSGRKGEISPDARELMQLDSRPDDGSPLHRIRDINDPNSYQAEEIASAHIQLPFRSSLAKKKSRRASADATDARATDSPGDDPAAASNHVGEEGCRACKRDDDHANLLLCEACNDEYHTYCLNPPLLAVPEGDFFCDKCKHIHSVLDDDGLDSLVSSLPPPFTSRFGEIVWAQGGNGFGWWPAAIYDPRLTVGGARQLARKNLGKKHLLYFFECVDAPFTVLNNSKISKWEEGFLEEYDLGRVAKGFGKNRSTSFERALHMAILERGKPVDMRLDWNHHEQNTPASLKAKTSAGSLAHAGNQDPAKRRRLSTPSNVSAAATTTMGVVSSRRLSSSSTTHEQGIPLSASFATKKSSIKSAGQASGEGKKPSLGAKRDNINAAKRALSHSDKANAIEPLEDGPLVCKILKKLPIQVSFKTRGCGKSNGGMELSANVGFITLPSRQSSTFACIRYAMENDLDDDCFQSSKASKKKWKFYIPKLGPVSTKQEEKIGPVLEFLTSTTDDDRLGDGTAANPLKIVFTDY